MTDAWLGDACSLVDAFRAGRLSPLEALDAALAAIERSELNGIAHLDAEAARAAAQKADVSLPFGGVPVGIKELERVAGWPFTNASIPLADEISDVDGTSVARLRAAGAVVPCLTTASEFGGVNVTRTKLHGATRNPWDLTATPGGSSGGSAALVAGGVLPIASGGDGGGSIRIPASFTGLFGLKPTFGRVPKGPHAEISSLTAVFGCLSRSVRDAARWLDVCNGFDPRDPFSLPRVEGWEAGLGQQELRGLRVAVVPDLGGCIVRPEVMDMVQEAGEALAAAAGLRVVDAKVSLPEFGLEWALSGLVGVRAELGDRWPAGNDDLTFEIGFGLQIAQQLSNLDSAARVESQRREVNEAMADLFDSVDLVIAAACPDVAFGAEGPMRTTVGDRDLLAEFGIEKASAVNGALTIPSNVYGNAAMSVPIGLLDGLPVGMQVVGRHHSEAVLLDLALVAERERPWPLTAPGAPL